MSGHTPGPWTVKVTPSGSNYRRNPEDAVEVWGGPYVATVGPLGAPSKDGRLANAVLIAAAPELADALAWLVEECTNGKGEEVISAVGSAMYALRKAGRLS